MKRKAIQGDRGAVPGSCQENHPLADAFQTTGSRVATECAVSLIDTAAKDHFLAGAMNGSRSYYVQKWLVAAIAIAYLKVKPSAVASPAQSAEIVR